MESGRPTKGSKPTTAFFLAIGALNLVGGLAWASVSE